MKKKIEKKREFRRIRSRLKRKIRNNAIIPRKIKTKYNLLGLKNRWKFGKLKSVKIMFPIIFCHILNTKETSKFLAYFQSKLLKEEPNYIFLSYKETSYIGLSASYLFDRLLDDYLSRQREKNRIIHLEGIISKKKEVNHLLFSIGHLKKISNLADNSAYYENDFKTKIKTFEFRGTKKVRKDQQNAADGLVNYFNECLKDNGFHFTEEAKSDLISSFTEIIDNAEQHSEEELWEVIGYYDSYRKECSFTIINDGKTFSETFQERDNISHNLMSEILTSLINNRSIIYKIFGKFDEQYYRDCIFTFMSIQDGISSKKKESGKDRTRGFGMMDVLEKMYELTSDSNKAKITLISGRTAINIDFEYEIDTTEEGFRVLHFNKEKSFTKIPDPKKVYLLKENFFGTLFTGSYQIDKEHLKEISRK